VRKKLALLIVLTILAFAVMQGMRLASGDGWSWVTTAACGVALAFQVVALWQARNAPE
jgi:hypothetical protein